MSCHYLPVDEDDQGRPKVRVIMKQHLNVAMCIFFLVCKIVKTRICRAERYLLLLPLNVAAEGEQTNIEDGAAATASLERKVGKELNLSQCCDVCLGSLSCSIAFYTRSWSLRIRGTAGDNNNDTVAVTKFASSLLACRYECFPSHIFMNIHSGGLNKAAKSNQTSPPP